jgi:hypothetical protein
LVYYYCTPLLEVSQPRSPISRLSPIVASIQGETGRHVIVYPVALVAASANRDTAFFLPI